ncbi:MAG TPA: outer membrane protein assembly factor BamE [Rhodocyclaceae bacterium]
MIKRACLLAVPFLAACSTLSDTTEGIGESVSKALDISPWLHPYRIDVRQGNLVTQDMVAQLKPGLTKDQVRFVLGTPLLSDVFHADRWDYVYRLQTGDGEVTQRRLAVFFVDGKLARLGGDVVGDAGVAAGGAPKPPTRFIEIKAPAKEGEAAEQPKAEPQPAPPPPAVSQ